MAPSPTPGRKLQQRAVAKVTTSNKFMLFDAATKHSNRAQNGPNFESFMLPERVKEWQQEVGGNMHLQLRFPACQRQESSCLLPHLIQDATTTTKSRRFHPLLKKGSCACRCCSKRRAALALMRTPAAAAASGAAPSPGTGWEASARGAAVAAAAGMLPNVSPSCEAEACAVPGGASLARMHCCCTGAASGSTTAPGSCGCALSGGSCPGVTGDGGSRASASASSLASAAARERSCARRDASRPSDCGASAAVAAAAAGRQPKHVRRSWAMHAAVALLKLSPGSRRNPKARLLMNISVVNAMVTPRLTRSMTRLIPVSAGSSGCQKHCSMQKASVSSIDSTAGHGERGQEHGTFHNEVRGRGGTRKDKEDRRREHVQGCEAAAAACQAGANLTSTLR